MSRHTAVKDPDLDQILEIEKKISFLDIYEIIGQSMSRHTAVKDPDLDQILEIEKETYRWIESRW